MTPEETTITTEQETTPENKENEQQPPKKGKEKLRSIMEVASALTSLGDSDAEEEKNKEESSSAAADNVEEKVEVKQEEKEEESKEEKDDSAKTTEEEKEEDESNKQPPSKRYIPEHKKPDAALTFPEKLMQMMTYADNEGKDDKDYCIGWLPDGKSFVVRHPDDFTRKVLPKYFKATKFSSFTRKLYRWGFRQLNRGIGPDDPIIFGNECFQRDNAELMTKLRSVTAAGMRKQSSVNNAISEEERRRLAFYDSFAGYQGGPPGGAAGAHFDPNKRSADMAGMSYGHQDQRKRMLLDRLIQEKRALGTALADSEPSMYGAGPGGHPQGHPQMGPGGMPNMPPPYGGYGPPGHHGGGMYGAGAAGGSLGFQSLMNKHRNGGFNPFGHAGPSGGLLQASSTNPMGMYQNNGHQNGGGAGGNNQGGTPQGGGGGLGGAGGSGAPSGGGGSGSGNSPGPGGAGNNDGNADPKQGGGAGEQSTDIVNAAINALRYSN